jgi:glyoxylase-like metal-dependent hydrolase (beta-lactamase superfamily II)
MRVDEDQSSVRRLELDDVRLTFVVDGAMAFSPATFFPAVPAELWPAGGMVAMSAGGLLVERDGRRLLIDAGLGPVQVNRAEGAANCGSLLETLAALGLGPGDIDVLALTHLHADHVGWVVQPDSGAKTFARARHVIAAGEWAGHSSAPVAPAIVTAIADGPTLADDGDEIFPGVHAMVTPGHSPGHTSYVITAGDQRLIAFGDAFHHPVQLAHPEWGSAPDSDGGSVPQARRRLLAELARPDTLAFATHFGDRVFGRVTADGGWREVAGVALLPPPRELP